MDTASTNNRIFLRGTALQAPEFSHEARGARFWRFPLQVCRLSGAVDTLSVLLREESACAADLLAPPKLEVHGEIRSFNNRSGVGSRLLISVFARDIAAADGEDCNMAELTGTLCKPPVLRVTPLGREICDMMLAVNRHYGRSDYLPCIAWGQRAQAASRWEVGQRISLLGRLQSRQYTKVTDSGPVERTAYEISVTELSAAES